jgi:hypothetical protein
VRESYLAYQPVLAVRVRILEEARKDHPDPQLLHEMEQEHESLMASLAIPGG